MQESIGVIIPARNDATGLPHAVASVAGQKDVTISSIVIVVGPSGDATRKVADNLAQSDPRIHVIDNPSGRTPNALNAAIAATTTDVIVRVDARSVLPPRYISNAIECLEETGAGNVGAIQRPVGVTVTERAIASAMLCRFGTGGAAYRGSSTRQKVDTAYLGVFRRQALQSVGGYDETFTRNQDAELNHRLGEAGYEVWLDPRLVVDYRPRPTIWQLAKQYWQYGWWRQLTIRKHQDSVRLRQVLAPALVIVLALSLILAVTVSPWVLVLFPLYAAIMIVVGLIEGDGSLRERLLVASALIAMHLGWGTAFIASFVITRLRPSRSNP